MVGWMLVDSNDIERLRGLPLFAGLAGAALLQVLSDALVRKHKRHTHLFTQGQPVTHFYVVLTGWVKLYRVSKDGTETVLEIFGPGESFAEGAIHNQGGYPANAETIEDSRILEIPTSTFKRRLKEDPDLTMNMLTSMAVRLKNFVRRIERTGTKNTSQRVGVFLLRYSFPTEPGLTQCQFNLPYDKQLVAARLGMKPESFSRALIKLRAEGVKVTGSVVQIDDIHHLRSYVDN